MEAITVFNIIFKLMRSICRTCGADFNGSKNKWACCACPMYIFKWTLKLSFEQNRPIWKAKELAECHTTNEMARITQQVKDSFKDFMLQTPEECWQEFGLNLKDDKQKDFFNEWLYMEEIPFESVEKITKINP